MSNLKLRISRGAAPTSYFSPCTITCTNWRAFSEITTCFVLISRTTRFSSLGTGSFSFYDGTNMTLFVMRRLWKGPTATTTTTGNTQLYLLRGCVHFHDQVPYSPWAESMNVLQIRTNQDTEFLIDRNVQRLHLYAETPTIQFKLWQKWWATR